MNSFELLLVGTFGLTVGAYILGRLHGARKVRKSTAKFIRHLAPYKGLN